MKLTGEIDMKVDVFALTPSVPSDGIPPRVWRISTAEGVFWLLQDGTTARLLPLPIGSGTAEACMPRADSLLARGAALALAAETAAASRWVRRGTNGERPKAPTANASG